jgi:hypothetical protein
MDATPSTPCLADGVGRKWLAPHGRHPIHPMPSGWLGHPIFSSHNIFLWAIKVQENVGPHVIITEGSIHHANTKQSPWAASQDHQHSFIWVDDFNSKRGHSNGTSSSTTSVEEYVMRKLVGAGWLLRVLNCYSIYVVYGTCVIIAK